MTTFLPSSNATVELCSLNFIVMRRGESYELYLLNHSTFHLHLLTTFSDCTMEDEAVCKNAACNWARNLLSSKYNRVKLSWEPNTSKLTELAGLMFGHQPGVVPRSSC